MSLVYWFNSQSSSLTTVYLLTLNQWSQTVGRGPLLPPSSVNNKKWLFLVEFKHCIQRPNTSDLFIIKNEINVSRVKSLVTEVTVRCEGFVGQKWHWISNSTVRTFIVAVCWKVVIWTRCGKTVSFQQLDLDDGYDHPRDEVIMWHSWFLSFMFKHVFSSFLFQVRGQNVRSQSDQVLK